MKIKKSKLDISLIIPAYNEELTIRDTIKDFYDQNPEMMICVVDNNSKDRTSEIVKETFSEFNINGKLLFEKRQGKAVAVKKAFRELHSDIYVMVDADTTYKAADLDKMLEPIIKDEADIVIGDRQKLGHYQRENSRKFHNGGNNFVRWLINLLFRAKLNDILSGYRAFSNTFVKNYPVLCTGFEIETEMTIHALDKDFRYVEVPITYQDRPDGSYSKLSTIFDGVRIVKTLFWIFKDYKPLTFFGILSFFSFLCGILFATPVVSEFLQTGFILHIPLAILSTGTMIFSLLLLSIGLILNTVVHISRARFEIDILHFLNDRRDK